MVECGVPIKPKRPKKNVYSLPFGGKHTAGAVLAQLSADPEIAGAAVVLRLVNKRHKETFKVVLIGMGLHECIVAKELLDVNVKGAMLAQADGGGST